MTTSSMGSLSSPVRLVGLDEHARTRNAELVALAAHRLDEDAELQFAASGDFHGVLLVGLGDAQRDVALRLTQQAVANHPAGDLVAFGAGERGIVDAEHHREGRRIDRLRRQRLGHLGRADGVGDGGERQSGDRHDVAGIAFVDRHAFEAAERQHLGGAALLDQPAVAVDHLHRLIRLDRPGRDTPGDDAAEIGIRLEDRAEHAERAVVHLRRRDVLEDEIEQRRHRLLRAIDALRHPAFLGRAVEHGKVELLFGRVERGEQVEHLARDHLRAGVRPVDLVDGDDRPQPDLERLGDDELGLRQRPLGGIDEDDRAVHHVEDALDLAAEVGVAGGIDDVDPGVLPDDRGRLGEDRDPTLALEIIGVHCAFGDTLVLAEGTRLLQEAVDQRGLAMVDVGDDRDVAQLHDGISIRKDERIGKTSESGFCRKPAKCPRHGLRIDQFLSSQRRSARSPPSPT